VNFFSYLFAIAAGSANPVQAGANAQLNKSLANPVWAAVIVYASGLAGMVLVQAVVRQAWPGARVGDVPWWAWLGGLLSIGSTVAGLTLAQKMGSGVFTGLSLTASLVMSVALDQFGWVGFKEHPASWPRLAGTGLMVAGIWLIAKF
jgi:transporter family-2 protein